MTAPAAALAQAERWVAGSRLHSSQGGDIEWMRARIDLQRGNVEAAIAAAERVLAVRPTWMGRWQAADCYFAAFRRLEAASERIEPRSTVHRDKAAELYRQVIDELAKDVHDDPEDPGHVVPWGFASLQLAQIENGCGRAGAARALLEPALAALERVAPLAHRDLWQPDTLEQAKALQAALVLPRAR